jgi:hypothetical protein
MHIEVIKYPASMTNHHNFDAQICCCLDHYEKCHLFDIEIALHTPNIAPTPAPTPNDGDTNNNDLLEDDEKVDGELEEGDILDDIWAPKHQQTNLCNVATRLSTAPAESVPRPFHTFIVGSTAIHLNYKPLSCHAPVDTVAEMFNLPDLCAALGDYVNHEGNFTRNFHTFDGQRRSPPEYTCHLEILMYGTRSGCNRKISMIHPSPLVPSPSMPTLPMNRCRGNMAGMMQQS